MNPLLSLHHALVRVPRTSRVASAFVELAPRARTVLDVGAGDGRVGKAYADRVGGEARGVDVMPQANAAIPVRAFDGTRIPEGDEAVEIVLLADVLHHAEDPVALLREALRVSSRAVLIKDHFAFGPVSRLMLLALDVVGNRAQGVAVRGTYASPPEWTAMIDAAGGHVERLIWPLDVHAAPIRYVTRSELQVAMRVRRRGAS